MTAEEYLAVPYVMVLESVPAANGDWLRQASYPELPGCIAQAQTPIEAIDRLEEQRAGAMELPTARQRTNDQAADRAGDCAKDGFDRQSQQQERWRDNQQQHVLQHVGGEEYVRQCIQR